MIILSWIFIYLLTLNVLFLLRIGKFQKSFKVVPYTNVLSYLKNIYMVLILFWKRLNISSNHFKKPIAIWLVLILLGCTCTHIPGTYPWYLHHQSHTRAIRVLNWASTCAGPFFSRLRISLVLVDYV